MTKVYCARYEDVNDIVVFGKKFHKESSGWERVPFVVDTFRKNIVSTVRTQGYDVLVARDEGKVVGFLIAATDQMIFGKTRYATDVHFVAHKGGLQLIREFEKWARNHAAACMIMTIATSDPEGRIERFYEAAGLERIGTSFIKWLEQEG